MTEIITTERLPFPLAKPNPDTFVTQASEIGYGDTPIACGLIYDISVAHAASNVPAQYASLSAALGTNGANIPQDVRRGGMAVKFINSGTGKYEQWALRTSSFSTNEDDWVSVTDVKAEDVSYDGGYLSETLPQKISNDNFLWIYTDKNNKILWAIDKDGNVVFGKGVPSQVVDYVNEKIAELPIDNYESISEFLGNLINGDKTLTQLLNDKVDKENGKALVNSDVAECLDIVEAEDYMSIDMDKLHQILGGRRSNGNRFENMPFEFPSTTIYSMVDPLYRHCLVVDKNNKIISCRNKEGVLQENVGIITPMLSTQQLNLQGVDILTSLSNLLTKIDSERDNFEIDNKLNMFDSLICIGDSVTDGHIYWRRNGYAVSRKYSYPTQLGKMFPDVDITNAGQAGITIDGWNKNKFPNYDFIDYNVAVIELGYNSGSKPISDTYDTDVAPYGDNYSEYADTGMGNYCQLIKKIQNANPYIFIILVSSRSLSATKKQGIARVAFEYDLPLIDLSDRNLYPINWEDADMPYSDNSAVHSSPWGYLLKASYMRRGIGKAIDAYYARAVRCVFGQNDWIWKITCELSDVTKGVMNTPYVEIIACYTGELSCTINSGVTFDGWYYNDNGNDILLSTEPTFTFNPFSYQVFKGKNATAINFIARLN